MTTDIKKHTQMSMSKAYATQKAPQRQLQKAKVETKKTYSASSNFAQ